MITAVFHDVTRGSGARVVAKFTGGEYPTDVPTGAIVAPILPGTVSFRMLHTTGMTINVKQDMRVLRYDSGDAACLIHALLKSASLSTEYRIYGYIVIEDLVVGEDGKEEGLVGSNYEEKNTEGLCKRVIRWFSWGLNVLRMSQIV